MWPFAKRLSLKEKDSSQDILSGYSDKDIYDAALTTVHSQLSSNSVFNPEKSLEDAAALRIKYASIQPARLRKELMNWIDFFEKDAHRHIEERNQRKRTSEIRAKIGI